MNTCLIVGGLGQDGFYLSRCAIDLGMRAIVTTRDFSSLVTRNFGNEHPLLTIIQLNPEIFEDMENVINLYQPKVIFNLAAQSSVGQSFKIPRETYSSCILPNLNILETIRQSSKPIRYFHAASGECFGGNDYKGDLVIPHSNPANPYSAAKDLACKIVHQYRTCFGVNAVNGYLYNHESVRRGPAFVLPKIYRTAFNISQGARQRLPLGNIDIVRDWGSAQEYMNGILKYMTSDKPTDFLLGTGTGMSLRLIVDRIFSNYNLQYLDYIDIEQNLMRPTEVQKIIGTNSFLSASIGWQPQLTGYDLIDDLQGQFERYFRSL